jgi:hypothetical protein
MNTFYRLLFTTFENHNQYLETLALITQASRSQIDSMASDLAWQSWDVQTASPSNA